jgi:hypothetical protein
MKCTHFVIDVVKKATGLSHTHRRKVIRLKKSLLTQASLYIRPGAFWSNSLIFSHFRAEISHSVTGSLSAGSSLMTGVGLLPPPNQKKRIMSCAISQRYFFNLEIKPGNITYRKCEGTSVPDPWHFGVDPDPSIFIIDLQDANRKRIFLKVFLHSTFWRYFYIIFQR